MSEGERQARLAEVIELGEALFDMALASQEQQEQTGAGTAGEKAEQEFADSVEELRAAAETFFRVLRKLVAAQSGGEE